MASANHSIDSSQFSPEAVKEAFSGIKNYIESGKGKKLTMMVVGEAGQGKSALANTLVPGAIVGGDLQAGTTRVQKFNTVVNEVEIEVWDTPGFGLEDDFLSDEDIMEQMRGCSNIDLVLFCLRMDLVRIPTRVHNETIRRMTKLFGKDLWKRVAFVLTFAKGAAQLRPKEMDLEEFFTGRCKEVQASLQEAVRKHTSLSLEDSSKIPVVPVDCCPNDLGDNPFILPDGKNWYKEFWLTCTTHLDSKDLTPKLIQANSNRIPEMQLIQRNDVLDKTIEAFRNHPAGTVEEADEPPLVMCPGSDTLIHLTSELSEPDDLQESVSEQSNLTTNDVPDSAISNCQTQIPATTNNQLVRRRRNKPSQNPGIRPRQQPAIPLADTLRGNENAIAESSTSWYEFIGEHIMKMVYDVIEYFKETCKSVLQWFTG